MSVRALDRRREAIDTLADQILAEQDAEARRLADGEAAQQSAVAADAEDRRLLHEAERRRLAGYKKLQVATKDQVEAVAAIERESANMLQIAARLRLSRPTTATLVQAAQRERIARHVSGPWTKVLPVNKTVFGSAAGAIEFHSYPTKAGVKWDQIERRIANILESEETA